MERSAARGLRCDLVLVSYNQLQYTQACLESLHRCTAPSDYRLLIVDNGSEPDVVEALQRFRTAHAGVELILNASNSGWVKEVNQGIRWSTAPYVCCLNNDIVVTPGWLSEMLNVACSDPRIGALNPSWRGERETLDAFHERVGRQKPAGGPIAYKEISECNGACLLVKRDVIEQVGMLDEIYETGGYDDSDFSRRVTQAGYLCVQAQHAFVYHWENVTLDTVPDYWKHQRSEKQKIFHMRWGERRQLAVVLQTINGHLVPQQLSQCVALARLGLRLHVVGCLPERSPLRNTEGRWGGGLAEHNNLKWGVWPVAQVPIAQGLWTAGVCVAIALKGFGRRWKSPEHRVQVFIAPSGWARAILKGLRWLHGAPVYRTFQACPLIEREVRQATRIDGAVW